MFKTDAALSACCGRKHLVPVQKEQYRQGAGQVGGRADAAQHPCHHRAGFSRGTGDAVTGQPQVCTVTFWGGLMGFSKQGFAVASSMLTFKNPPAMGGTAFTELVHLVSVKLVGTWGPPSVPRGKWGGTPAAPGALPRLSAASSSHPPLPTGTGRNAEGQQHTEEPERGIKLHFWVGDLGCCRSAPKQHIAGRTAHRQPGE